MVKILQEAKFYISNIRRTVLLKIVSHLILLSYFFPPNIPWMYQDQGDLGLSSYFFEMYLWNCMYRCFIFCCWCFWRHISKSDMSIFMLGVLGVGGNWVWGSYWLVRLNIMGRPFSFSRLWFYDLRLYIFQWLGWMSMGGF